MLCCFAERKKKLTRVGEKSQFPVSFICCCALSVCICYYLDLKFWQLCSKSAELGCRGTFQCIAVMKTECRRRCVQTSDWHANRTSIAIGIIAIVTGDVHIFKYLICFFSFCLFSKIRGWFILGIRSFNALECPIMLIEVFFQEGFYVLFTGFRNVFNYSWLYFFKTSNIFIQFEQTMNCN